MSALPLKADMCGATRDVRYGPIADMRLRFKITKRPPTRAASRIKVKRCSFSELDAEWSGRVQLDDSFRVTPKMMPRSSGQNHEGSSRKRLGVRGIGVLAECHAGLAGNDCEKL